MRSIIVPWLCLGDFNDFLSLLKKYGGNPQAVSRILNFQMFAASCELVDLESKGSRFMWCNQRLEEERVKEQIDQAMADPAFRENFPKALSVHTDSVASDHHFLLVCLCYQD